MSIAESLTQIKRTLPSSVTLVAVSKTKPLDLLQQAYAAGQRDFGENYVQELCEKQAVLPVDIRWHFIGHLQSNKVKYIAPFVHLIHGVDSLKLLQEINKQAAKQQRVIQCLLQIYIAKEESKFGLDFKEAEDLLLSAQFATLANVNVVGLMGMATNTSNEEILRREFTSLATFAKYLRATFGNKPNLDLKEISMGMSGDYPLAVACGSTLVRIGSSIFGARNYNPS